MKNTRRLIVNADDFGLSPAVNRGIIEAHERGIVTSASLMVNHNASSAAAARWAREHPSLGVGLHVDLGEWICRDREWVALYEVVRLDDAPAVTAEVHRQLDRFRELTGREPTHLDSHQHVHRKGTPQTVMTQLAASLGLPLRHFAANVRYCGDFYGQTADGLPDPDAIAPEQLIKTIELLESGTTELACHPSAGDDVVATMYRHERMIELRSLCDPMVRATIDRLGIELCNFDIARGG